MFDSTGVDTGRSTGKRDTGDNMNNKSGEGDRGTILAKSAAQNRTGTERIKVNVQSFARLLIWLNIALAERGLIDKIYICTYKEC